MKKKKNSPAMSILAQQQTDNDEQITREKNVGHALIQQSLVDTAPPDIHASEFHLAADAAVFQTSGHLCKNKNLDIIQGFLFYYFNN